MKEIEIKIRDIRDSLTKGDLPPGVAVSHLNELAALLGNVNSEIRLADLAYSKVLYECLSEDGKANIPTPKPSKFIDRKTGKFKGNDLDLMYYAADPREKARYWASRFSFERTWRVGRTEQSTHGRRSGRLPETPSRS